MKKLFRLIFISLFTLCYLLFTGISSVYAQISFDAENLDYVLNGTNNSDRFGQSVSSAGDGVNP